MITVNKNGDLFCDCGTWECPICSKLLNYILQLILNRDRKEAPKGPTKPRKKRE